MGKTCIFEFPLTFAKLLFFKLLLQLFNFPPQYYQSFLFGYFYFYFFVLLEWRKIIAVSLWQSTNSGHQPWCCLSHVRGNRVLVCLQVCTKRPAPAQYGYGGHRWKKAWKEKAGRTGEGRKARSACGDGGKLLLCCFSCVLWPDHSMHLSSLSCTTQSENCQCSTKQMGTLSSSYRGMEAPQNHGEKLHSPWLDKDWAPDELLALSPNSVVAMSQWAEWWWWPVLKWGWWHDWPRMRLL